MNKKIWAVGGGKGGVGKSVTTVMLGTMLAKKGKKVVLIDADLGGSNLHTFMGIRYPAYTLADFMQRRVNDISHTIMETPVENLSLICGADDILGLANPKYSQKMRLFNHINKIDADLILIDLGAGTSFTTMDFFLFAPNKIIVLLPLVTSMQNAYGFIKSSLYRHINRIFKKDTRAMEIIAKGMVSDEEKRIESVADLKSALKSVDEEQYNKLVECLHNFRIQLIVNNVKNPRDTKIGTVLEKVSGNYLDLNVERLGHISFDPQLDRNINNMLGYLTSGSSGAPSPSIYDIAGRIIRQMNGHPESYNNVIPAKM